ncbi:MAG: site-specific integrase [Planctomycetes bacterium]|nr:site-specific integrase [Planctomycetota bacterium]
MLEGLSCNASGIASSTVSGTPPSPKARHKKQLKLIKGPKDKAHKKLAEEQLLKELKSRKPTSKKAAPDWLVVNGVLRGFLRHSRKNHEPSTYRWYKDILKGFNRLYGRLRVTQLRRKHVTRWFEKSGYNPTSQNRALGALKRAFNWAVEEEYLVENPIAHVRKPKGLIRDRILTADERTLILTSIKGQAFRDFVAGMTLTGCRPGEVARVDRDIVDLERGVWNFQKHKTVKKTRRPRIVYLCPEAIELTKRLLAQNPEGPIFRNSRGKPWTGNAFRIRFRNLRKKHPQLKGVIAYTYRASFATDALEAGVPDATVSALLGHTGTDTLHRFYNRLSQKIDHLKEAAAKATQDRPAGREAPRDTAEGKPPGPSDQ